MELTLVWDRAVLSVYIVVVFLIAIDTLFGWILAISRGEFEISKAPQFLRTNVLPYAGPLMLLAIGAMALDSIKVIYFPSAASAGASFISDIVDKARSLKRLGVK